MHGVTVTGALSWTVEKHASLVVGCAPPTATVSRSLATAEDTTQTEPAF